MKQTKEWKEVLRFKKKSDKSDDFKLKNWKFWNWTNFLLKLKTAQKRFWMTFYLTKICLELKKSRLVANFNRWVPVPNTLMIDKTFKIFIFGILKFGKKNNVKWSQPRIQKVFDTVIRNISGYLGFKALVLINFRIIRLEKKVYPPQKKTAIFFGGSRICQTFS